MVRVVARASRPGGPLLEAVPVGSGAGQGVRSGAVDRRLAGPVPATDPRAVSAPARPRRRRRVDHGPVDACAGDDHRRVARESLEWLDTTLAADKPARPRVRICITGDGWVDLHDWPPSTSPRVLHLRPGGLLAARGRPVGTCPSTFTYDPATPTPVVGGPLLSAKGGYRDDSRLAGRADVLSFTGDVLTSDLYVTD